MSDKFKMNQTYAVRVKRLLLRFLFEQFRNPSKQTHFGVVYTRVFSLHDLWKDEDCCF